MVETCSCSSSVESCESSLLSPLRSFSSISIKKGHLYYSVRPPHFINAQMIHRLDVQKKKPIEPKSYKYESNDCHRCYYIRWLSKRFLLASLSRRARHSYQFIHRFFSINLASTFTQTNTNTVSSCVSDVARIDRRSSIHINLRNRISIIRSSLRSILFSFEREKEAWRVMRFGGRCPWTTLVTRRVDTLI